MIRNAAYAVAALSLLAGCKAQEQSNNAAATGNVPASAETRNAASAAPVTGEQALAVAKQREKHMEALGDATKAAGNSLKSSSPDMAVIRKAAADMNALAPKLLSWFPQGTAVGVGKSRAKPEIWSKAEDFAIKAHDFETAAGQFDVAARSGDLSQIKATFAALGKTCKACHDLYRAPKKD
jgi:cytochrome c556